MVLKGRHNEGGRTAHFPLPHISFPRLSS